MLTHDNIDISTGESADGLTRRERRAAVLKAIAEADHPDDINQCELGDRLGVHQSTISRDISALRREIAESIGTDDGYEVRLTVEIPAGGEADAGE